MLAVQADVVGGREGLLGEAGDAIHRVVPAEVQPEVIPLFCLPGYNLHALERKAPGKAEAVQGTPELAHAEAQRGLPSPLLNTFWENPESPPSTLGHWPRCCGSDTDFPWGLVWLLLSPLGSTSQVPPQTPGGPWLRWQHGTGSSGTWDLLEQQLESGGMPWGIPNNTGELCLGNSIELCSACFMTQSTHMVHHISCQ